MVDDFLSLKQSVSKNHVYPAPPDAKFSNEKGVYRRDLVHNFVKSLTANQLREVLELENMYGLLKGEVDDILYEKLLRQKGELSKNDYVKIRLMKEILVDLHKLKHGDKHVNVSVGYKDIQDMMFSNRKPEEKI